MTALDVGARLGDYIVDSVIVGARGDNGAIYSVFDADNRNFVVQHIPTSARNDQDLANRRARFKNAVHLLAGMSHDGMVQILSEFEQDGQQYLVLASMLAGWTLDVFCENTRPISEERALDWARKLCSVLAFLENQTMPFTVDSLEPQDILIDYRGDPWLLNLRLHRFFQSGAVAVRAATAMDQARTYESFGKLLEFIVSQANVAGSKPGNVSSNLQQIAARCREQPQNKSYRRFSEVQEALQSARTTPAVYTATAETVAAAPPLNEVAKRLRWRIFAQSRRALVVETILLLLVLPWWLGIGLPDRRLHLNGKAIYAIDRHGTFVPLDPYSGRGQASPRWVGFNIRCAMQVGGRYLLLGADNRAVLDVYATSTLDRVRQISLNQPAVQLVLSTDGTVAYCISASSVSVISLHDMRLSRILGLRPGATDAALSSDGAWMFFSVPSLNAIWVMDTRRGIVVNTMIAPMAPGPLALSPDEKALWVASRASSAVFSLSLDGATNPDADVHRAASIIEDIKGVDPIKIRVTRDGQWLLVLCRESGTINRIRLSDGTVEAPVETGGSKPVDWCEWTADALWVANEGSGNIGVVNPLTGRLLHKIDVGIVPTFLDASR